jgi:HlyD family secretion protein
MRKKSWWIVGAIVLVAIVALLGWQVVAARQARADTALETTHVQQGALEVTVNATGSLQPRAEVAVAFSTGGRVEAVLVEEGDLVVAGQPLVQLETDLLALQLEQAQAGLAVSQANLDKLLAAARPEDITVSQSSLTQAASNQQELRVTLAAAAEQARLSWTQSANALRDAQANYENIYWQNRELEDRVGVEDMPDEALDAEAQAWRAVENAEAAMEQARLSYEQALQRQESDLQVAGAQVTAAQANLDRLLQGASPTDIAASQAAVEQARVAVDIAQAQLDRALLLAPLPGTVTALYVQPGEMAGAGQAAVGLSDLSALEIEVQLDETDVARVAEGQTVVVRLDAFSDLELAGRVTYIALVAETQAGVVLYPVTVRLNERGDGMALRAGMTAEVEILLERREDVLIVPLRAVETEGNQAYVYRVVDGDVERVAVEMGLVTDVEVEIVAGLAAGDEILVVPAPPSGSQGVPNPLSFLGGGQ